MRKLRVLAFGAHPDDVEYYCGGTLAKYKDLGHEVCICSLSNGDMGHKIIFPKELAEIRKREAHKAADILGGILIWPGVPEEKVSDVCEIRCIVLDVIREVKPDVILTHAPEDYHPNHRDLSVMVWKASFNATVPHIKSSFQSMDEFPVIYHMDTYSGVNFNPTDYVDITDTMSTKKEMMSKHESQLRWMKDFENKDILEQMEVTAQYRGYQCGVKFAEGFRRVVTATLMTPERLLP